MIAANAQTAVIKNDFKILFSFDLKPITIEKSIIDDKYHEHMFFKLIPAKLCKVYFLREKYH